MLNSIFSHDIRVKNDGVLLTAEIVPPIPFDAQARVMNALNGAGITRHPNSVILHSTVEVILETSFVNDNGSEVADTIGSALMRFYTSKGQSGSYTVTLATEQPE